TLHALPLDRQPRAVRYAADDQHLFVVGKRRRTAGPLHRTAEAGASDLARAGERLRVLVEPRREQARLERLAVAAAPRDVAPPQHLEILAANSRLVDVEDDVADQDHALGDRIARHEAAQIHRAFLRSEE